MIESTVKASNFGPHGNFAPFTARFVASLGKFCAKNESNLKMKRLFLQLLSHSLFCRKRFDNRKPSEKMVQGFHEVRS